MDIFQFCSPTRYILGKGVEDEVGAETRRLGNVALLHYGGGSIKRSGLYERVLASLKQAGVAVVELSGVKPNPRLSLVQEGIDLVRREGVEVILAVGGGSTIDSAKAIAMGAAYEGNVWDFYSGAAQPKAALPVGVVLTIPAAGSEGSPDSVITNEDGWLKRGATGDVIRPAFALMDPELTFTLPPYQTGAGSTDIMVHILERYFTNVDHVELTDRLCEATLKTMIDNVPGVRDNPQDYDARAEIMWSGTVAHNGLLNTGRLGDWASHAIEHELSALYDVAHGAGLAVIVPAWMRYVYKANLPRFIQYATRVWNVEMNYDDPERTALEGIRRTKEFFRLIGMPTSFEELGVPQDRIEEMARKAVLDGPLGHFMTLQEQDVAAIYRIAAGLA